MGIDYDASYGDATEIQTAPVSVKVIGNIPPGDRKYRDYVPKKELPKTKPSPEVQRKKFQRRPVARYDADYIPPEESADRRETEKKRIKAIAREIWEASSKHRKLYKAAEKLIGESTPEEKNHPSPELQRAFKIIKRHRPITKQQAIEKAMEQFYGVGA